jgi:hypothetical protein
LLQGPSRAYEQEPKRLRSPHQSPFVSASGSESVFFCAQRYRRKSARLVQSLFICSFTVSLEYLFSDRAIADSGVPHCDLVGTWFVMTVFYKMNPVHYAMFNEAEGSCTFQTCMVALAFGGSFNDGVIDLVFHRELPFRYTPMREVCKRKYHCSLEISLQVLPRPTDWKSFQFLN